MGPPLVFSFADSLGRQQNFHLKVTERGRFRRHTCDHAPLKLDFKKQELRAAGLSEYDKYKLVMPCFSGRAAEVLVRREYLAYRAYRLLSPTGFRVRLLRLTVIDPYFPDRRQTSLAFLIESKHELADRLMAEVSSMPFGLPAADYQPRAEVTHALFQYLIGNTDWDAGLSRNVKSFVTARGELIPVGYDFDFSSWVNAPYARPRSDLMQHSLSQRVYLGYPQAEEVFAEAFVHFTRQRAALENLVGGADLPRYEKRRLGKLIERFYAALPGLSAGHQFSASLLVPSPAPAAAP